MRKTFAETLDESVTSRYLCLMPAYPTFYVYVQTTIECVKYVFAGPDMTKKDAETLAVEQARVDGHIVKSVTSLVY